MTGPISFYKKGDEIEGLRVLDELGQGAASTVYLAQDPKSKQIYAVKHVHRSTEKDERFLDQAVGEYEIASQLDHEHIRKIPKIHKVRAKLFTQLTDVFLVMEFFDGVSMEKKRPKTYEEAVEIFVQTAGAMAHMHERGFVHADMKPNNIIVQPGPNVKIIDLGQSCKSGTVKPRIQGTPDYIAPEQVLRKPITPATDVYNLGATMYWTLTKKTVPTAMNMSTEGSLMDKVDPSMVPKATPVVELDPRCHPKLSELIMQCVQTESSDRPQSMGEVRDRLELILGMIRAKQQQAAKNGKGSASPQDTGALMDLGGTSINNASKAGTKAGTSVLGVKMNGNNQA